VTGERADLCESITHDRLHHTWCVPLQLLWELGAAGSRLLLLHYSIDHRVRRLCAGYQPRLVALAEERRVWSLPRVWPGAHRHVLQPHAGRGAEQVSTTWTTSRSHQLELQSPHLTARDARTSKTMTVSHA